MISKLDKIRGMFLGVFIGDRLGLPVEMWSAEAIEGGYGKITDYLPSKSDWSDDTQLTLAVAEGLANYGFDIKGQVEEHKKAFVDGVYGMGGGTKSALKKLYDGVPWDKTASTEDGKGVGNGIAMKISPVSAAFMLSGGHDEDAANYINDFIVDLASITHKTDLGLSSAFAHFNAVNYVLGLDNPKDFDIAEFTGYVLGGTWIGEEKEFPSNGDKLSELIIDLVRHEEYDNFRIIHEYKQGTSYAYSSLPFTYMFFVKNPQSIESMYNVINAGGDADSNAAMIGSLLGAMHGTGIFPKHLVEGLEKQKLNWVFSVADKLYHRFVKDV